MLFGLYIILSLFWLASLALSPDEPKHEEISKRTLAIPNGKPSRLSRQTSSINGRGTSTASDALRRKRSHDNLTEINLPQTVEMIDPCCPGSDPCGFFSPIVFLVPNCCNFAQYDAVPSSEEGDCEIGSHLIDDGKARDRGTADEDDAHELGNGGDHGDGVVAIEDGFANNSDDSNSNAFPQSTSDPTNLTGVCPANKCNSRNLSALLEEIRRCFPNGTPCPTPPPQATVVNIINLYCCHDCGMNCSKNGKSITINASVSDKELKTDSKPEENEATLKQKK